MSRHCGMCQRLVNQDEENSITCRSCNTYVCCDCTVWLDDDISKSKCRSCGQFCFLSSLIGLAITNIKQQAVGNLMLAVNKAGGFDNYAKGRVGICCNLDTEIIRVTNKAIFGLNNKIIMEVYKNVNRHL